MKAIEVSVDYGGRTLTLQTGKLAKQADASILATYGETVVLVTVVAAKEVKENQDFFPLTVDFQEKYYAAGRIPGGFFKREAKPSDRATLSARMIDRPCRPLFPEDFLCETNVVATVLSTDGVNETDLVASIAASAALHISDIPFGGPVATARVGIVDGEFKINMPPAEQGTSRCELLVSGVRTGVLMVEGAAREISEKEMIDAIDAAHKAMQPIFDMQDELREKVGKPKRDYPKPPRDKEFKEKIKKEATPKLEKAFAIREKLARYDALAKVKKDLKTKFENKEPKNKEEAQKNGLIGFYLEEAKSEYARALTLDTKKRIDGRSYKDIRGIHCETGLLPRVHGSALFTRGETQVLGAITLGTSDDEQKIDSISGSYQKTFMLHYNFPPYSVGEARPLRPPGRREIGHGFLAERALSFIIPPKEVFPYTIRLVSEVLESNGSSSMATVCSGSMALMDAGVPIAKPVAGVAMGLIKEGEKYAVLSDILGDEDHLGDMDFKVCGTADGITAFQMDLKIGGVSRQIMEEALEQAREGRIHVLSKMAEAISEPKTEFSQYAPRIFSIKVRPDKVREVIGSGGKVIRSIIERTGVKIDIEDDGTINIASSDNESAQKAIDIINQIVAEPEIGRIYEGKVTRIADFGAFVEILPGTDGLCHISELEHYRVRRVEDVVKEGEIIKVKCLDVDSQGKIRLSRKALLPKGDGPKNDGPGPGPSDKAPVEATAETAGAEAEAEIEAAPAAAEEDNFGNRADMGASPRPERTERPRSDRGDRPAPRGDRFERAPREPRSDRGDRFDRPERSARPDRGERDGGRDGGRDFSREGREPREARPEREPREARPEREPRAEREARPSREPRESREPRSGGDREPRGGGDRDREPRGGGDRDRGEREPRSDREGRETRSDRPERGDRPERNDRGDRFNRADTFDRGGRPSRPPAGDRERPDRFEGSSDRGPSRDRLDRGPRGGSDRPERGNDRGNDRGPDRGNDRGPDRGNDRGPRSSSPRGGGERESEPRRSSSGGGRSGHGRDSAPRRGESSQRPRRDDDSVGNRAPSTGGRTGAGPGRPAGGGGRFARFERGGTEAPRSNLRFDRDEERLPDFETNDRRFFDEDE